MLSARQGKLEILKEINNSEVFVKSKEFRPIPVSWRKHKPVSVDIIKGKALPRIYALLHTEASMKESHEDASRRKSEELNRPAKCQQLREVDLPSIFVQTTSLRGFGKLHKTPHVTLKVLWCVFIISMTLILAVSTYDLIKEYFEYHTNVQVEERVNDPTLFPGITVCSLRPFSLNAHKMWKNGSSLSPQEFSNRIKAGIAKLMDEGRIDDALSFFQNDKLSTYFQNIPSQDVKRMGHEAVNMIPFCLMRHGVHTNPSVAHEEECSYTIRRIDSPRHLSCFDIDIVQSRYVSSVSLLLSNTIGDINEIHFNSDGKSISKEETEITAPDFNGFLFNTFNQEAGFKITLHEAGTHPDMQQEGYKVQVRSSTSIEYKTTKEDESSIPHANCFKDEKDMPVIVDKNETTFAYTYEACVSAKIGEFIRDRCNCISAFHIRPSAPTPSTPYCQHIDPKNPDLFITRLECVRRLNSGEEMEDIAERQCRRRCSFYHYEAHMSVANWSPSMWQLHWMGRLSKAFQILCLQRNSSAEEIQHQKEVIKNFTKPNSHAPTSTASGSTRQQAVLDNIALVNVARIKYTTKVNKRQLQITASALLSRLGGIGSLTLGLTLTFLFEIIEVLFLIYQNFRNSKRCPSDTESETQETCSIVLLSKNVDLQNQLT